MPGDLKKLTWAVAFGGPLFLIAPSPAAGERQVFLSVPGIPGPYCAYGVEKRLLDLDGVRRVDLLWQKEQIRVLITDGKTVTPEQILTAVKESDYPYEYELLRQ